MNLGVWWLVLGCIGILWVWVSFVGLLSDVVATFYGW